MSYCPCSSPEPAKERGDAAPAGRPLEGLIEGVIKGIRKGRLTEEEMAQAWKDAVGPDAARHSVPVSFKGAVLTVNVDNSGWLYELTVRKKKVVGALGEKFGGKRLKDIRFRIGDISAHHKKE